MIIEKKRLINANGHNIEIYDRLLNKQTTKALIGKASKQSDSLISMEAYRKAYTLPEIEIQPGYTVHCMTTDEYFVVVATYKELINNNIASTVCRMLQSNCTLSVSRDTKQPDDDGNIKLTMENIVSNVKTYIELGKQDIKQYNPGKNEDSVYEIYAPSFELELTDRLILTSGGINIPMKLVGTNYLSYLGLVVISAKSETRK